MQVTSSVAIMQVLSFYCNYVALSTTSTLVDLFVAIMQVTVSVAIRQLEVLQHICR